jgi:hypothetical protein
MKCLSVALLFAFGAVAFATQAWIPGKEYVYEYKTRTMTGIPSLKTQVSGLGLRSKVIVQVKSPNELVVKMTNIGVARAVNEVFSDSWSTWRRELPLSYSPLEGSQGLSIPFKVNLNEGQVHSIEISETEPVWSVNIKRALASQLSLNVLKISRNHAYVINNEISKEPEEFYTVEEPSVTGECKTYYTIVPLPDFIARSEERDLSPALKSQVGDRPAFIVTKTKDFTFCNEKPAFIHSSVVDENELGSSPADSQHKRFSSRTSVARYLIRGEPMHKFVVERVWTEGEYIVRPFATNTESIFIASNQTLVLEKKEPVSSRLPEPSNLVRKSLIFELTPQFPVGGVYVPRDEEYNTLRYEGEEYGNRYSGEEYRSERSPYKMMNSPWKSRVSRYMEPISPESRHYPKLTKAPTMVASSGERVPVQSVIQQIQELLQKIENNLESWEQQSQKEPQLKMVQVARALRVLSLNEIEEAYKKISSSSSYERTYSEERVYSGERRYPSEHIRSSMERRLSSEDEISSSFEERSPFEEHSRSFEERSPSFEQRERTLSPSQPSSSSMVWKTKKNLFMDAAAMCGTNPCIMFLKQKILSREIKGERAAQLIMVFPATVKTPTPELLRELVQLVKGTKSFENKQVWYTGLLSTATLIYRACIDKNARRHNWAVSPIHERPYCTSKDAEILIPYLKEQLYQTKDSSKLIVLVQAIGNLGVEESYPLLRPIITGKVETEKQVRVKAIFAVSNIFENSRRSLVKQVQYTLKPIFSSPLEPTEVRLAAYVAILKSRPNETFFTEAATSTWFEPSQQVAQFVTSSLEALANCTFPTHMNISRKAAMALPLAKKFDLGLQYSRHVINSHVIPERRIGSILTWAHFSGKWSLIPENIYMSLKNHMGGFDVPMFEGSIQSQGIQSLINRLFGPEMREELPSDSVIHTRKDRPTQVNLWMKLMGNMERVITADTLQEWAQEGFIEYTGGNEYMVNYQKALPLQDTIIVFPVESGLPIYVSKKTPLFISIRGTVQVELDMKRASFRRMEFPKQANLKLNLKPLISISRLIEAGISSPLTKEVFISGHKTNVHASLPGQLEIQYRNKEVEIVTERQHNLPSKIELIAIKSTPFTGRTEFYNFVNKNLKPIEVQKELNYKKFELTSLEKSLGLALEADVKMDQPLIDFAGLYNLLKPHTVLTAIQFVTVPHTLKKMEYNLKLDLSRSETKALRAKIYYSSEKKTFSLKNFDEEERLEKLYYKEKKSGYYGEWSKKSNAYFLSPELELPELRHEWEFHKRSPMHRRRVSEEYETEELSVRSESNSRVRSVHAEVVLEGSSPRHYRSSVVMSRSPDQTEQQLSVMIERESSSSSYSHWFLRANAQFKYPLVPMKREQMLATHMNALGSVSIKYGTPEKESSLTARIGLRQTGEWRQRVEESNTARECSKHEQEGVPYSYTCLKARREAQSLNWMAMEIESHNTPRSLKNLTLHFDDFLKAAYYHHMTNKRFEVQNPTNKVKIVVEIKPVINRRPYQILDVYMYKPEENTFWEGFKMSPLAEAFLPLTAQLPTSEKVFNKIMGYQYTPFCEISREHVTTFDNVTYRYPLTDCYYLLAKDCSKNIPVEVYAKQTSAGKKIKLNLGKMNVEINEDRKVIVNGQPVQVEVFERKVFKNEEQRNILVVSRPVSGKIVVNAQVHGIKILGDGKHLQVQMSNMFRGRTCGLCGDMNGEKVAEFKDPKGCVRKSIENFAMSYVFGSCQNRNPTNYEAEQCVREHSRSHYESSSWSSPISERSSSGIRYVNKVVPREGETCFSVKPVPECPIGTQPTGHVTKEIGFHCVRNGRMVNDMIARSRSQVLDELYTKSVDFTELVAVPESCKEIPVKGF